MMQRIYLGCIKNEEFRFNQRIWNDPRWLKIKRNFQNHLADPKIVRNCFKDLKSMTKSTHLDKLNRFVSYGFEILEFNWSFRENCYYLYVKLQTLSLRIELFLCQSLYSHSRLKSGWLLDIDQQEADMKMYNIVSYNTLSSIVTILNLVRLIHDFPVQSILSNVVSC